MQHSDSVVAIAWSTTQGRGMQHAHNVVATAWWNTQGSGKQHGDNVAVTHEVSIFGLTFPEPTGPTTVIRRLS